MDPSSHKKGHHGPLPIKVLAGVFAVLLVLIFVNIGIGHLPIPSSWKVMGFLAVSGFQTILMVLFFMELIHEDRFFLFIIGSTVFFVMIFMVISYFELQGRDFFEHDEGIKIMRGVDQEGNFAPRGPVAPQGPSEP